MSTARHWRESLYRSPLYGLLLRPREMGQPIALPRDPWPGDPALAERLLADEAQLAGALGRQAGSADLAPAWLDWLHGFVWLRDLRALGGDAARRVARSLASVWMEQHERWDPVAWRTDTLAVRLVSWTGNHAFFVENATDDYRLELTENLTRQVRHLERAAPSTPSGLPRLRVAHGLILAGIMFPRDDKRMRIGLRMLAAELPEQVRADGLHVSRSGSRQLEVLQRLVEIRGLLASYGHPLPPGLDRTIAAMAPALRLLRHGDGGLGLFHDTEESFGPAVDLVLAQAGVRGRPLRRALDSGFERMTAGRTVILVDTGGMPDQGEGTDLHASPLAMEVSVGRERLIVNCGGYRGPESRWRQLQRTTAAHSTLCVGDTNACEVRGDGTLGRRPEDIQVARQEDAGSTWLDASHDGYLHRFGLVHQRRLYLADGGRDLRGEDVLKGQGGQPFTVRFHLHPASRATLVQDGAAVRITLPGGQTWRLRASGGRLGVSESIYLARYGEIVPTLQAVIEGTSSEGETHIRWALQATEPA